MSTFVNPVVTRSGERDASLTDAWQHGLVAATEFGLTVHVRPVPADAPGAWRCTLNRGGVPVGLGFGQGPADLAEVGALYEALEHYVSTLPGSAKHRSLISGEEREEVPEHMVNWAAGTNAAEATVHALNQAIERDAMSLLLIDQFLAAHPRPLRVVDADTLPADLHDLWAAAQSRVGSAVWLLDMTTDLGVPAYWAYTSEEQGRGASLSPRYAMERALAELIQRHCVRQAEPDLLGSQHTWAVQDFGEQLANAAVVAFTDSAAPGTPQGHLVKLVELLRGKGYDVQVEDRHLSKHLVVLNVFVPGLERLTTDGQVVIPGPRGRALLRAEQAGERATTLDRASSSGWAAVAELGLTTELRPVPQDNPGAWLCRLYRDGHPVPHGLGVGKGKPEAAKVGAVFEALERHLRTPVEDQIVMRSAKDIVVQDGGWTTAITLLKDGEIGCARYISLVNGATRDVPLFLSIADYRDSYDYSAVGRYSSSNGWAAGIDATEATVHAINQTIERDAMSLLLIEQFLTRAQPLRVVDARTLPLELAESHRAAEKRLRQPVWLLDITTGLGVPAYWACIPGQPARIRGCAASLSAHNAVEQALAELVQRHTIAVHEPVPDSTEWTENYPPLHRCYLADFTTRMASARKVSFVSPPAPTTPREHLDTLVHRLRRHGFDVFAWERYAGANLAVVNVFIPGAENFMAVVDGHVVIPGRRGRRQMTTSS